MKQRTAKALSVYRILVLITLAGLVLNAALGWWWADPLAALLLVPLIVREGLEGWRGECCECDEGADASVEGDP